MRRHMPVEKAVRIRSGVDCSLERGLTIRLLVGRAVLKDFVKR